MRKILPLVLLLIALCSGCAGKGLVGSYCGPLPEDQAIRAIAADGADCLSTLYPPGHTSLHLMPAKKAENGFATAFEGALRSAGFTILAADAADSLTVAYTLDALEKDASWYLQLRFSDGKAISRAYSASGQPEAGRSQTPHEFKRSLARRVVNSAKEKTVKAYDAVSGAFKE